jgi:filamentous hemagglutinin family protein
MANKIINVMALTQSKWWWKLGITGLLVIVGVVAAFRKCAFAQVIPDRTLGAERSVVTHNVMNNDLPSEQISGGARRQANLFHSFQEFSVSEGQRVYFTNPAGIENILIRVTGNNSSNIFGKLGVSGGNANLFLINPNGIIFGPHASLDVKGSFVATTANAIQFNNQGFFNASAPNVPPLLTVNPSALLFNQLAVRSINSYSVEPAGQLLEDTSGTLTPLFGLKVANGQSLLLVGGNVSLDSGGLNALGGRVELGGLAGVGTVGLNVDGNNLHLSYPAGVQRADVSLTNRARVDASGESGGNILVQGRRVTLAGGSQIVTTTLGAAPGGTLAVTTSDSVELSGVPKYGANLATQTLGNGKAGDIKIDTQRLLVKDGAQVSTATIANGLGGQLTVTAPVSVELIGTSPNNNSVISSLISSTVATGDAGNITINTGRLLIQDGAAISAESSAIEGVPGSNATIATGRGGNLTLIAPESVELRNGALYTDTLGSGDAGDITIKTGRLLVQDGGNVSTATSGQGKGGNLTINAPKSVELIRIGKDFKGNNLPNLSAEAQDGSTGSAGKLTIATGKLIVRDGAEVAVSSKGTRAAGNLELISPSVLMDNGTFSAETTAGQGNINLASQNLVLRRGSNITTSATGIATGGNITIKTDVLTALENSDISANADKGPGGRVKINASGIFGTEFRQQPTPESDITATSTLGPKFSGTVQINTLGINPSFGLVTLPVQPVDVTRLISQGCLADVGSRGSKFIVTGRGGLPPNPSEPLSSDAVWSDTRLLATTVKKHHEKTVEAPKPSTPAAVPMVPATGWVFNGKGEVTLIASAPTEPLQIPWLTPTTCDPLVHFLQHNPLT